MASAVTETRVARSADRILALPERARRRPWLPFALIVGLGAVVILAGLGRSSLFIDEVFSWNASNDGVSGIVEAVQQQEVTPPLYYVILHAWIALTGAESEWALRLPSALAGIGLVAAVAWLGTLVGGRRTGAVAGLLAALSPLVLQYAQEVRAYVFVMLAVTLAAAAALKLAAEPRRRRWLVLMVASAATAVLLHYTAILVVFPLAVWLLRQDEVPRAARIGLVAATALPFLVLVPLLLIQLGAGHHNAEANAYARITPLGLLRLFATPFDGRALDGMTISYELGLLALVDALALLAFADRFRHLRTRWLLVGACVLPLLAVLVVSAFLQPLALTRYTAVAAPFMLVAIGVVVLRVPRAIGAVLLVLAIAAGGLGVAGAQTSGGQWPDVRGAMTGVADRWRPGDVVVGLENLAFSGAMTYYDRSLPARAPASAGFFSAHDALQSPSARRALAAGHRVWVVSSPPTDPTALRAAAAEQDADVRSQRQYGGSYPVQVDEIRGR
jgi:mannosyltransferase